MPVRETRRPGADNRMKKVSADVHASGHGVTVPGSKNEDKRQSATSELAEKLIGAGFVTTARL